MFNKLSFYKSSSVMLIESSMGISYGEASPFIQFKFAPRADSKAKGQWDDANCFWITSYVDLFNFVAGLNALATGKIDKYEMKNPLKNVMVQIRMSTNEQTNIEYVTFHFFRGQDVKIKASLVKGTEYAPLFGYFKNLMDNYNTMCAISLLRNDIYYDLFVKGKPGADKGAPDQKPTGGSGGQRQNTQRQAPPPSEPEFGDAPSDFGDDVPF